jgi:putative transposon-encoded protein
MRHSTAAKYSDLLNIMMVGEFKIYDGERIPRYPKILLLEAPNKESLLQQAKSITNAIRRQLKPFNDSLAYKVPKNKVRKYIGCKVYLTAEESEKLSNETQLFGFAGWYYWVQENPSNEEFIAMQESATKVETFPEIPNEEEPNNGVFDYG